LEYKKYPLEKAGWHKKTYGFALAFLAQIRTKKFPHTSSMREFFITIFAQKSVGKTAAHRKG